MRGLRGDSEYLEIYWVATTVYVQHCIVTHLLGGAQNCGMIKRTGFLGQAHWQARKRQMLLLPIFLFCVWSCLHHVGLLVRAGPEAWRLRPGTGESVTLKKGLPLARRWRSECYRLLVASRPILVIWSPFHIFPVNLFLLLNCHSSKNVNRAVKIKNLFL